MATLVGKLCRVCAVALVFGLAGVAESKPITGSGLVEDVGPEGGLSAVSSSFLFRGSDEILVGTGRSGVYKSFNRGQTWIRSMNGLVTTPGVEPLLQTLCQSASAPEIVYAGTFQDGVSRSTNFGDSWGMPTMLETPVLSDCAVDPSNPMVVYVIVQLSGGFYGPGPLFKSIDGGQSFSSVGDGLPDRHYAYGLAVAPTNPLTVYVALFYSLAGASGGLFVSFNGGLNFQALPNAPSLPFAVYVHPTQDGTLLVLAGSGLFLSTDGGSTFEPVGAGLPPSGPDGIWFDPAEPTTVYAPAGPNGLFRSVDVAHTFVRLPGPSDDQLGGSGVVSATVRPRAPKAPVVIYAGTSFGPIVSDDGGITFAPIHEGFRAVSVNDLAIDAAGRLLVASSSSLGVFRSITPGVYEPVGASLPREVAIRLQAVAAASDDPQFYVAGGGVYPAPGGVYRTTDGGGTWTRAVIPDDPSFWSRTRITFAPSDSRRVYIVSTAVDASGLFRSDDGGQSFALVSAERLGSIAVDPRNPDVLYAGSWVNRGLFKSTDGGRTLTQRISTGTFTAVAIDPQHTQTIYAGLNSGLLLRSLDDGQFFSPANQGLTGDRVLGMGIVSTQPMRLFTWMHAGGLFRSIDGADSWQAVDTGEALRRSTAQTGQTALVIDTNNPEHVYLGNASVLQFVNQ